MLEEPKKEARMASVGTGGWEPGEVGEGRRQEWITKELGESGTWRVVEGKRGRCVCVQTEMIHGMLSEGSCGYDGRQHTELGKQGSSQGLCTGDETYLGTCFGGTMCRTCDQ